MKIKLQPVFKHTHTVVLLTAIGGCSPSYIRWVSNNGASQDQFMRDRYSCLQETQQRISGAYVNQYGGAANSTVTPTCSAWRACMAARGYYQAANTSNLDDFKQRGSLFVPEGTLINCSE